MAGSQYRCPAEKSVRVKCQHQHSFVFARPQLRPPQFGVLRAMDVLICGTVLRPPQDVYYRIKGMERSNNINNDDTIK